MRNISKMAVILSSISILLPSCSAAEEKETQEELFYKDLLFSNNPTGKTYFGEPKPPIIYIDNICWEVNNSPEPLRNRKIIYKKIGLIKSEDQAEFYRIDGIINNMIRQSVSPVGLCPRNKSEISEIEHNNASYISFNTNKNLFSELWTQKNPDFGYASNRKELMPRCHIRVKADKNNKIRYTQVNILLDSYELEGWNTPSTHTCIIRSRFAARGTSGITNWPDSKVLPPNWKDYIDKQGRAFLPFWDFRIQDTAHLNGAPGQSWPQVRTKVRQLLNERHKK